MFWVVQSNLYKEDSFQELVRLLNRMDIPHILVKPLPFSLRFTDVDTMLSGQDLSLIAEPVIDSNQNIMVCGAYTLSEIAKERNWFPGAFINDNFEHDVWIKHWSKDKMLNGQAITSKIKDLAIPDNWTYFFARPTEDTKSFSGKTFHRDDFISWMSQIQSIQGFSTLTPDTPIMIAPLQEIHAEYRFFVVDKKLLLEVYIKSENK